MRKSKTLSALLRPDRALHRQNVHFFRRIGVYLQGSQVVARLLSARIERNDQHGRVARHDGPLGEFRLHAFARLGHFQHDQRLVARIDESDRLCDRRAFRIGRSQIDRFFQKLQGRLSAERSGSERERNKKQKTSHRNWYRKFGERTDRR